jgi:hypothetical protein
MFLIWTGEIVTIAGHDCVPLKSRCIARWDPDRAESLVPSRCAPGAGGGLSGPGRAATPVSKTGQHRGATFRDFNGRPAVAPVQHAVEIDGRSGRWSPIWHFPLFQSKEFCGERGAK